MRATVRILAMVTLYPPVIALIYFGARVLGTCTHVRNDLAMTKQLTQTTN